MPKPVRVRDDYKFLKLVDARGALNLMVNLIGVIAEYGTPCHSKGTDWCFTLKLVDETLNNYGFVLNIFAEEKENLPKVAASGDIIQVSHVMIKTHNGEPYAAFNKRCSSFALYEGKYGESCLPYQTSSLFRRRDQDLTFVGALRKWVAGVQLNSVSRDCMMLRQLKEGHFFDLICKLLHVSEEGEDGWLLFLWDGTDAPPLTILSNLQNETSDPLPLQVEAQSLPSDIVSTFPSVGTILRAFVELQNANFQISSLVTGRWVKFINMSSTITHGFWRGVITQETKLRFVLNDDIFILDRQRDFEARFSSKMGRMPFFSFPWPSRITEVDRKHEHIPLVTLMDMLTHSKAVANFKCVVRVVACVPSAVEDFRSLLSGVYRIRVTLEDPTARLHAYIYGDDAEIFFEGNPLADVLQQKWNVLLGVGEYNREVPPRNPPWVECCIKSYYLEESDVCGSRRFRIFNTKLVG